MGLLGNVISTVVGGVLGNKGANDAADKANKANDEINKRNLQFAANATKIRRDDMRNAGINPILAANPGAAAQTPQQIGAVPANTGAVASAASALGGAFTKTEEQKIARERIALDTLNSSKNVEKVTQEIENLKANQSAVVASADLARSQALTQETNRQLLTAQTGVQSAVEAGKKIENAEAQARYDWSMNQGLTPWRLGVDIKNLGGGATAQGAAALNNLVSQITTGPTNNSAKTTPGKITKEINAGERDSLFSFPGFRVTKKK